MYECWQNKTLNLIERENAPVCNSSINVKEYQDMKVMGLSDRQVLAGIFVANGMSRKEVAKQVRVSPETISLYKADPMFTAFVDKLHCEFCEKCKESARNIKR